VFGTLFIAPAAASGQWEDQVYKNTTQAHHLLQKQVEYYQRLVGDNPDMFRAVQNKRDLKSVLSAWESAPAVWPGDGTEESNGRRVTHPVGLLLLLEGAEGLHSPRELEEWYEAGVRIVGPEWYGNRFCGNNRVPGEFTREGFELLEVMAGLGIALDLAHMNEKSTLQALDRYPGAVVATHGNCRALLRQPDEERHFTDLTIRRLIERDGMLGVVPYAKWLRPGWSPEDDPRSTGLKTLVRQIDHVCQIAGDALHVGLGTDFDGGFGWPQVPYEVNTIADLQKLAPLLTEAGFSEGDVANVFAGNWRARLERFLPET
jgi:membrane dipeptidase